MTPQQIVGVAVRLFAIWLVVTAIQAAGSGLGTSAQPGTQTTIAPYVFSALFLVVAILLWLFPLVVAHRLVPRTKFDNLLHVPTQEALVVACVILGLWVLVVRAVPAIAYYVTVAIYWSRNGQSVSSLDPSLHFGFVLGLVQLVMALFLIFKARDMSAFILLKHQDRSKA
jgi:hypothetical protein